MYILWLLHILRLLLLFFKGRRVELCKGLAIAMLFTSKLVRAHCTSTGASRRNASGARCRRRTALARRARFAHSKNNNKVVCGHRLFGVNNLRDTRRRRRAASIVVQAKHTRTLNKDRQLETFQKWTQWGPKDRGKPRETKSFEMFFEMFGPRPFGPRPKAKREGW